MAAAPARDSQATAAPGRAVAYVDAVAVERNCALLKARLGAADLCAVVKADGYGHGATACAARRWPAAPRGSRSRPPPRRRSCAATGSASGSS